MRNRILMLAGVIAVLLSLVSSVAGEANVYSCENSPYLCYECRFPFFHPPYCHPLGYGIQGSCGCQDSEGCGVYGSYCEAIIIVP